MFEFRPGPARLGHGWAGPRFGPGWAKVLGWEPPKVVEFVVLTVKLTFLHEIYSNSLFLLVKNTLPIEFDRFYSQKVLFLPAEVRHRPGLAGPEIPTRILTLVRKSLTKRRVTISACHQKPTEFHPW